MLDYEIKSVYEDMEMRLIKSMKRNLQRHLDEEAEYGFNYPQWQAIKLKELKRYQRQNKDIINEEFKGYNKKISKFLKDELREGALSQFSKYKEAMGDTYKASKKLNKSFFRINDKKVNALIKTVNNDLKTGNKAVLRKTNDQYRKVIFQSQLYVANGAMTPKQAIDRANEAFLRAGMNVIEYKDGRRVNIASYSEMAVRTAGKRASLMGEGEFRKKYKQPLIQISAHGTSCPLCKPWQGKILIDDVYGGGSSKDGDYPLLSYAMDQGLFHPNCKHGVMTYNDEIDDIRASYANGKDGSESDAQYQEDLNYINRKIKEYQRLEAGSLDETNIKDYGAKKRAWMRKGKAIENRNKYEGVHITSPEAAKFILAKGFLKSKMNDGIFGKGVYASKDKNVIDYYRQARDTSESINLIYDTTEYAKFKIEGLQSSEAELFNNLAGQMSIDIHKEYEKILSSTNFKQHKHKKVFLQLLKDNGFKGLVLEQDLSMIDEVFYQANRMKIDKVNGKYIDPLVGGSQIVGWDKKTIKIKEK